MQKKLTVSAIITVYNLEKFIAESLLSVFNQTRYPDEIVVIDDCSIDKSAEIIFGFGNKLKYLKMPVNSGVLMANIEGIKAATGDILCFLDGDDIWMPTKIEEVEKKFLENDEAMMISHNCDIIDGNGHLNNIISIGHTDIKNITKDNPTEKILSKRVENSILCYKGFFLGSAYSIRKKYLDISAFEAYINSIKLPIETGYENDYKRLSTQDQVLATYMVLKVNKPILLINKILFRYRIFGGNSSANTLTKEKAIFTVNRSYATNIGTYNLVKDYPNLREENRVQQSLILQNKYLLALYSGKYIVAFKYFCKLTFHYYSFKLFSKELVRYFTILFFGVSKFLRLKNKSN